MLSEKTIEEMKAGAEALAKYAGLAAVDPDYMAAMIRTQERAKLLKIWENDGHIQIERQARVHTNIKKDTAGQELSTTTVVHVGQHVFTDEVAELTGAFPSETLVALIALTIDAGEGFKK